MSHYNVHRKLSLVIKQMDEQQIIESRVCLHKATVTANYWIFNQPQPGPKFLMSMI